MKDPVSIVAPETGMVIFSTTDKMPMIYTGTAWENLCTSGVNSVTSKDYFVVKGGIPYIPALISDPVIGNLKQGVVY